MGTEIERKYKVRSESYRQQATSCTYYRQGYLSTDRERTIRIRIAGSEAFITIKGDTVGCTRKEYEYAIPVNEAREILDTLCPQPHIEKRRYTIPFAGHLWEIDEFMGENEGLSIAEIELDNESEHIELPDFIGEEVTGDPRYYNSNLAMHPYKRWEKV